MGFLKQEGTGFSSYRNGKYANNNPPNYSVPYLFETWFDGTNNYSTVQIGNTTATVSIGSTGNFGISYFTIANNTIPYSNGPFHGFMSEIIVYNTYLTTIQRQKIEGYLSWKYGIQTNLPTTHPFYNSAPIP